MALISVIIPVYKAEDCLNELYGRLVPTIETITKDFEIILIDDFSPDNSWFLINELAHLDARVRGFRLSRNFGQHRALTAGIDLCSGDYAVIMDCDLQDPPEEIVNLYAEIKKGYKVVLARRCNRQDNFFKRSSSQLFYRILNFLSGLGYDPAVGVFCMIDRQLIDTISVMREQSRFINGLMSWMGFATSTIDVHHGKRFKGKSSYSLKSLMTLACDVIVSFSNKPLYLSIGLGLGLSVFSFLLIFYLIFSYAIFGVSVNGWYSIVVLLCFFSGATLTTLGIIGIYIGKIFEETKNRPLYLIEKKTSF